MQTGTLVRWTKKMLMARLKQKEVRRRAERDREVRQQKFNLKAHKRWHNFQASPQSWDRLSSTCSRTFMLKDWEVFYRLLTHGLDTWEFLDRKWPRKMVWTWCKMGSGSLNVTFKSTVRFLPFLFFPNIFWIQNLSANISGLCYW